MSSQSTNFSSNQVTTANAGADASSSVPLRTFNQVHVTKDRPVDERVNEILNVLNKVEDPALHKWTCCFLLGWAMMPNCSREKMRLANRTWLELSSMAILEGMISPNCLTSQDMEKFCQILKERKFNRSARRDSLSLLKQIFETLILAGEMHTNPVIGMRTI